MKKKKKDYKIKTPSAVFITKSGHKASLEAQNMKRGISSITTRPALCQHVWENSKGCNQIPDISERRRAPKQPTVKHRTPICEQLLKCRGFAHSNKTHKTGFSPKGGLHSLGSGIKIGQVRDNKNIKREGLDKNEERNKGLKSQKANCHTKILHENDKRGSL